MSAKVVNGQAPTPEGVPTIASIRVRSQKVDQEQVAYHSRGGITSRPGWWSEGVSHQVPVWSGDRDIGHFYHYAVADARAALLQTEQGKQAAETIVVLFGIEGGQGPETSIKHAIFADRSGKLLRPVASTPHHERGGEEYEREVASIVLRDAQAELDRFLGNPKVKAAFDSAFIELRRAESSTAEQQPIPS